jgi:hypothetical protein
MQNPLVGNAVLGKVQSYWEAARDGTPDIGALLLIEAGLPGDGDFRDFTTVASVLASTADEATFTNYQRKTLVPVVTVDNVTDQVRLTIDGTSPIPIQWSNAGGAVNNNIGAIVYYYDPTPGASTDATRLFLAAQRVQLPTDGTHFVISIGASGIIVVRPPA